MGFSIAFTEMAKEAGTSEAVKGAVMSAFYWGYAFSQVRFVGCPDAGKFQSEWKGSSPYLSQR